MNKISLAKRLNNNKRGYLIINANQGKHRPALIEDVKNEYETLAKLSEGILKNALVIGFAETAIAIGATLAGSAGAYFMQTTRENICAENEYIYFTEAHSHAMEQRLVLPDIKAIYDKVERIVFVEDEITTGNMRLLRLQIHFQITEKIFLRKKISILSIYKISTKKVLKRMYFIPSQTEMYIG